MKKFSTDIRVSGTVSFEDLDGETWAGILGLLNGRGVLAEEKPEEKSAGNPLRPVELPCRGTGLVLYRLRKIYRLSQKELGDAIGYSDVTVSNWERGNCVMSTDAMEAVMKHFDLDTLVLDEKDFEKIARKRAQQIREAEDHEEE